MCSLFIRTVEAVTFSIAQLRGQDAFSAIVTEIAVAHNTFYFCLRFGRVVHFGRHTSNFVRPINAIQVRVALEHFRETLKVVARKLVRFTDLFLTTIAFVRAIGTVDFTVTPTKKSKSNAENNSS